MYSKLRFLTGTVLAVSLVGLTGCPVPGPLVGGNDNGTDNTSDNGTDNTSDNGTDNTSDNGTGTADPGEFTAANAVRGGKLYDKWWAVVEQDAPTADHALWATRPDLDSNTRTGADTWRCKECHGWDYKGVDGVYSDGSHRTGFAGLFATTSTAQSVFDTIKTDHGYGAAGLADADIWDLAKFVLEGQVDTSEFITDGAFNGDIENGKVLYDGGIGGAIACAICHGADGTTINFAEAPEQEVVGDVAGNPWEFQHKVRFGQPGAQMPAAADVDVTNSDLADIGAFAQTLAAFEE